MSRPSNTRPPPRWEDAGRLGLDAVRLQTDLAPLNGRSLSRGERSAIAWRSSRWKDVTARSTAPGRPDVSTVRAVRPGGAKLIWGEAAAVVPEARANPRQLVVDDKHAPVWPAS